MILDKVVSFGKYKEIIPFHKEISDFLKKNDLRNMANGKYEIMGKDVYLSIQEYKTQKETDKKWESHKKYLDIQIMIDGVECIGYSGISHLTVAEPYHEEQDILFYHNSHQVHTMIVLTDDDFCVFYGEDGHKPGYYPDQPGKVRKAVIKVRYN